MSKETNEGVVMRCKTITANLLIIVGLLVEPITYLAKLKASLEASIYTIKPTWTVNYSKPFISPSLSILLSFNSIMRSNSRSHQSIRYWWITVESYAGNSAGRCGRINRTGKMKYTEIKNRLSFIDLVKGGHVFCRGTNISWKWLLKQSRATRSNNSLIPINFSY